MTEINNEDLNLKDPKVYEIGYLLVPLVPEADKASVIEKEITSLINKLGGIIISESAPEMRKLEYTIRKMLNNKYSKFANAYFGAIKFELNPADINKVNDAAKKSDNILRYLLIESSRNNESKVRKVEDVKKSAKMKETTKSVVEEPVAEKIVDSKAIDEEIDGLLA
ncbi:MAG TPA: 30S ribosomal protein S6 [Candidatus Paceibacterota bacterium]|nr:small subunit ribosomal protein [Patescibacteria group bacterium]